MGEKSADKDRIDKVHTLNWVFFGSGSFARELLEQFSKVNFLPPKVVTNPPKRKGRGLRLKQSSVALKAIELGLDVNEVESPNKESVISELKSLNPDFIVVSDYGKILKSDILNIPRFLPLNIHPSLLPKYRGAAPIERAIMAGEKETGITVFVMDEGIDTGPILLQDKIEINEVEAKGDIIPRLAGKGASLLKEAIEQYLDKKIRPVPQPLKGACYAEKIKKDELWIDFNKDAREVLNRIRALSPRPGARTYLDGKIFIKIIKARVKEGKTTPGKIIPGKDLLIACSIGILEVVELIPEGKRAMSGREFLRGYPNLSRAKSPLS